jgi:Flp pilus assembly protein CpaB|tara:strand:- start:17727 stop:17873 length:147 start_codon:yes stop_codon:yes gene_type:complete
MKEIIIITIGLILLLIVLVGLLKKNHSHKEQMGFSTEFNNEIKRIFED